MRIFDKNVLKEALKDTLLFLIALSILGLFIWLLIEAVLAKSIIALIGILIIVVFLLMYVCDLLENRSKK